MATPVYSYQKKGSKIVDGDIVDVVVIDEENLKFILVADEKKASKLYDAITEEIEVMRIFQIKVSANTSIYPVETLANIFGSIPIVADAYEYEPLDYTMKFTEKNSIVFHIKLTCPVDAILPKIVMTGDLVLSSSSNQTAKILYQDIKLCTLTRGQELDITLYAARANASSHNHATPVRNVHYRRMPKVRVKKQPGNPEILRGIKDICPKNVFDIEDSLLIVARNDDCIMCRDCLGKNVGLKTNSQRYEMIIQSRGAMSPQDILDRAVTIYNDQGVTMNSLQ